MRFLPGQSGNPSGRTPGVRGGRTHALMTLDRMLAKPANQAFLGKALEEELRKNPLRFFRSIIMPLIPHETRMDADEGLEPAGWRVRCGRPCGLADGEIVPSRHRRHYRWYATPCFIGVLERFATAKWWSGRDSNSRPPRCERGALPTELPPH